MKRFLLALLLVPAISHAGTITIRSAPELPADAEQAKVVSNLIVSGASVVTYYNETTEQVCTYAASINGTAPALSCVTVYSLSDDAREKVLARAAATTVR